MPSIYSKQCKVCNSIFRTRIEKLSIEGMNPEQIFRYLQSIQDKDEKDAVIKEDIKPSSIRRHLDNHFNREEEVKVKYAETQSRIEKSRDMLNTGVSITIDKINSMSHMIDVALIRLEEIDSDITLANKSKYQLSLQTMNTCKGLIESLAKLTGELQQEGAIDINFFNMEITTFVEIVLSSIRSVDKTLELGGKLELEFSNEFKSKFKAYKEQQTMIVNGDAPKRKQRLENDFNDGY